MSVDLPPATSNVEEVTPMEVTAKNETIADDGMFVCCIEYSLILLIV